MGFLVSQLQEGILMTKWWKNGQNKGRVSTESETRSSPHLRVPPEPRELTFLISKQWDEGHIKIQRPKEQTEL